MAPAAQANLYATEDDIRLLLSDLGLDALLDDDDSGTVEAGEQSPMTRAVNLGTARVKLYCQPRYADEELAESWAVNWWATVLAAWFLVGRRNNPRPDALRELVEGSPDNPGVMTELREVRAGQLQIPDIGTRNVDWPAWSNIRVDARYRYRQARVQRYLSEGTPTQFTRPVDHGGEWIGEN